MNLQELEQLFLTRQSCRSFDPDREVDKKLVEQVCKTALLCPSACNAQPWKIIAVYGEKKRELTPCMQHLGMNKFASDASVLLAVCEGKSNLPAKMSGSAKDFTAHDLGMLTAHLVLSAESAGLATCILGWRNEKKIATVLGLKEKTKIPVVIALGYPSEGYEIRPKKRKDFEDCFTTQE